VNIFSARKGKSRMQILAEKIGFTLKADWDYSLDHAIRDFTFSGMDKTRPASYNVLSAGRDGARWKIFDHNGSRPGGLWPLFRFQTMIYVEFTYADPGNTGHLGHYFITPKAALGSFWMRLKRKKGEVCQVQDTATGPFLVVAESRSALAFVPQGLLDALGRDKRKRYSVEVLRNSAVFYRANKVISVRDIPGFFDDVLHLMDFFKGRTAV
jgi:hypothetical protein